MKKNTLFSKGGKLMLAVLGGMLLWSFQIKEVPAAITDGKVLVEGLDRSADYCILPDSDKKEISYDTMYTSTDPQKQMAIKEIYARRGRLFVIREIQ